MGSEAEIGSAQRQRGANTPQGLVVSLGHVMVCPLPGRFIPFKKKKSCTILTVQANVEYRITSGKVVAHEKYMEVRH